MNKVCSRPGYISDMAISDNTVMPEISINTDENSAILKLILKHENFVQMINDAWGKLKEPHDITSFNVLGVVDFSSLFIEQNPC